MRQYVLVDTVSGERNVLREGKNVIGRSGFPAAVDGVMFIGLESPFSTISRLQAFVELANNGDAWLSDCGSTNGTYLAANPGSGVRLIPHRFYQLKPGNRIVFGDKEMLFDDDTFFSSEAYQQKSDVTMSGASSLNVTCSASLSGKPCALSCASNDTRVFATSSIAAAAEEPDEGAEAPTDCGKPVSLLESRAAGDRSHCGEAYASPDKVFVAGKKRGRLNSDEVREREMRPVAAPRQVHWVCFSGMDGAERARVQKLAKKIGWKATDSIVDADVLVVNVPVARTPKFLIAVGRGIPVVTEKFFDSGCVSDLEKYVPALSHGCRTYSSASLRKVIFCGSKAPFLEGMSFYLGGLPQKTRSVAREIILCCGGHVARARTKGARCLTDEELERLYDCMLRGEPF